jgi:hypothetical protein
MKLILDKLVNLSNWKVILLSGLIIFTVYLFVGLFTNQRISPDNLFQPHKVLQSQFNYSGEKAFEILNSYSSVEKRVLMAFTIPCD